LSLAVHKVEGLGLGFPSNLKVSVKEQRHPFCMS